MPDVLPVMAGQESRAPYFELSMQQQNVLQSAECQDIDIEQMQRMFGNK